LPEREKDIKRLMSLKEIEKCIYMPTHAPPSTVLIIICDSYFMPDIILLLVLIIASDASRHYYGHKNTSDAPITPSL
jgi:hypothetical protein